jgi:hypothetical protein
MPLQLNTRATDTAGARRTSVLLFPFGHVFVLVAVVPYDVVRKAFLLDHIGSMVLGTGDGASFVEMLRVVMP